MVHKSVFIVIACVLQATQVLGNNETTSECREKEEASNFLDIAVEMINKVKNNYTCCQNQTDSEKQPLDCSDLLDMGHMESGLYTIYPQNRLVKCQKIEVFCDMDTDGGGWTVLQRRGNFSRPDNYFFKSWNEYKEGFGDKEQDFWLGNDNIFALTNQKPYSVRFDLTDFKNLTKYAIYDEFWITDESNKYTLHISDYRGTAGDSMTQLHNNQKFSTKDQKNNGASNKDCSAAYKGGWWYSNCYHVNLNGRYLQQRDSFEAILWKGFRDNYEPLAATEIKIRPKTFRPRRHDDANTTANL